MPLICKWVSCVILQKYTLEFSWVCTHFVMLEQLYNERLAALKWKTQVALCSKYVTWEQHSERKYKVLQNTKIINIIMYCGWSLFFNDKKDMSCTWLKVYDNFMSQWYKWVSTVNNNIISTAVLNNLIQMWLQTTKINAFNQI